MQFDFLCVHTTNQILPFLPMHPLIQVVVHVFEPAKPAAAMHNHSQRSHRPRYPMPNAFVYHMQQKKEQQENAFLDKHCPHICTAV